jgi:DMSO/TMAO reductase YedYZ molybdopterin-dependent catalytic subunit
MTTTIDRRKFLAATGVTGVTAAAAGVSGELLVSRRLRARPAAAAPAPTVKPPELKIAPMTALPADETLNIAGLSPFYTPDSSFYRVDTAFVVPQVAASTWQLRIHGMVDKPMVLTFDDLIRRPMIEHDVTLTCVSEAVGGGYIGNARWQGILLADVLREAGIQAGADQIVMRDVKGMTIGVATDPVLDGRKSLLAVGMNGQLLPAEHGYPVRAVIPGLYGYVSATKWVVDMELTTFGAFNAYWVKQGWSQQAPIKTESRIDVPKGAGTKGAGTKGAGTKGAGTNLAAGQVTVAGVAWAQHRGIEAVEVSVDGSWYDAKLAVQDTIDTWRQWYYVWDATPGPHVLQVRATDQTGHTQTAVVHRTEPNGATGYHTVRLNVS